MLVVEGPFSAHLAALSGTLWGAFPLSTYLFFSLITWWPFQGQGSSWICFVFKPFIAPKYNPWVISLLSTYSLPWGFWDGSVQFSHSVVSNSLWPHGLQHARLPCPSPTPRPCSNSCPSSQWCHPTISSSVDPFSSCLQSFPASGSFPTSQFFASGDQSIGVSASASVLSMNISRKWPAQGHTAKSQSLVTLQQV